MQAVIGMAAANLRSRAAFSNTMPSAPIESDAATHHGDEFAEGSDGGASGGQVEPHKSGTERHTRDA